MIHPVMLTHKLLACWLGGEVGKRDRSDEGRSPYILERIEKLNSALN
jgi:hypothetical protein